MQLARRFRIPAIFCALAVLLCALTSRPYAEMGISDDGTYIPIAQHLAETGHVVYNGWGGALLGWQLYLGAAFIKLFGFSFTAVRMSTLLVAVILAWLLQRTVVLAGVSERNATLGTLAFVLSPLYLMLSVTYMNDIFGLFAVVICLYGCLRALQAATDRSTISWLCFAVATNAVFGTARQIAWLGILAMVPSTLYLIGSGGMMRERKRILLEGSAACLAGAMFIFVCMQWLSRQPYTLPPQPALHRGEEFNVLSSFFHAALDLPFLLLPIVVLFLPELRRNVRRSIEVAAVASTVSILILLAIQSRHAGIYPLLEPTLRDWVTKYDGYGGAYLAGRPPVFLHTGERALLTIASLGGLLGLIVSLLRPRQTSSATGKSPLLRWRQLGTLVAPFAIAYALLLVPRAASVDGIYDRYLLEITVLALPCMLRYYQEQIQLRLSTAALFPIAIMAVTGIAFTHNMFAAHRACADLAAELRAKGVPDTSVDGGWEYNFTTELRHSNHINDPQVVLPSHAYVPAPPLPAGACYMPKHDETPHIHPVYAISYDPNACYGPAPFTPVRYSRWLASTPGTLYAVYFLPPAER